MSLILTGLAAAIGIRTKSAAFNAPKSNPIRSGGKSSGGRSSSRPRTSVYLSWKKMFGGVAVPDFIDLSYPGGLHSHFSSARGVRPYSFYKTSRA